MLWHLLGLLLTLLASILLRLKDREDRGIALSAAEQKRLNTVIYQMHRVRWQAVQLGCDDNGRIS